MRTVRPPKGGKRSKRIHPVWTPAAKRTALEPREPLWKKTDPKLRLLFMPDGRREFRLLGTITMDVGGVLLGRYDEFNRPLTPDRFGESRMTPHALEAVELFELLWGKEQLYILKNESAANQADETFDTLEKNQFFSCTRFLRDHYVVVRKRDHKGDWCRVHGADFHIDDYNEVGMGLPSATMFLAFKGKRKNAYPEKPIWSQALRDRERYGELKVQRCRGWQEVVRVLLDTYTSFEFMQVMLNLPSDRQLRVLQLLWQLYRHKLPYEHRSPHIVFTLLDAGLLWDLNRRRRD